MDSELTGLRGRYEAVQALMRRRRAYLYTFGGRSRVPAGRALRALDAADAALDRGTAADVTAALAELGQVIVIHTEGGAL